MSLVNWWSNLENTRDKLSQARLKLEQYRAVLRLAGAEIERRNRAIRTLTAFAYQAGRLTEPAALYKLALIQALETTNSQLGAIVLIDPESKALLLGAHVGLTAGLMRILTGRQFDAGATTLMPFLVVGEGALLEECSATDADERLLLQTAAVTSLVSLPLQSGHQLIGSLVLGMANRPRYSQAEMNYAIALSQATVVVLETLRLREKLWHMAESLLSWQGSGDMSATVTDNMRLTLDSELPALPPLQARLSTLTGDLGSSMAAIFALDEASAETTVTLLADYGLSPLFTSTFARCRTEDQLFPFERLIKQDLVISNIGAVTHGQAPLLAGLMAEGARSLIATCFTKPGRPPHLIFVAATDPSALTAAHLESLLPATKSLLPFLADTAPLAPTLPMRSVHVASLERQATDDDLEKLLAAMMTAEEEVQRHNADFVALHTITEMLNGTFDLGEVLDQVVSKICDLLEVDAAWLFLAGEDRGDPRVLYLQAHRGLTADYVTAGQRLSVGDGFEGSVARQNKGRAINDMTLHAIRCHLLVELTDFRAVAAAPLLRIKNQNDRGAGHNGTEQNQNLGVFAIAHRRVHSWQARELRLLTTIANQIALSVNNARLYNQLKESMSMVSAGNEFLQEVNRFLMENQSLDSAEIMNALTSMMNERGYKTVSEN
jgi:GAF domain-containing protein